MAPAKFEFSAGPFLAHTRTFHELFAVFATAQWAPITSFLVKRGHLLIRLSLLAGLFVRVSAVFGMLLLGMYWMAHMNFPCIETNVNFLLDYHIAYIAVLAWLLLKQAGHVWGASLSRGKPGLRPGFFLLSTDFLKLE